MMTETAPTRSDSGYKTVSMREDTRKALLGLTTKLIGMSGVRVAHSDTLNALMALAEQHPDELLRIIESAP